MKNKLKKLTILFVSILSIFIVSGCGNANLENKINSVDDLFGNKIGVQLGTTGDILVSENEGDELGTVVERFNKGNDAITALKQGKIDAVVIDVMPAQAFVKANPDLMVLDEEFTSEDYAICVSKSKPELTAALNEGLDFITKNGTLSKIIDNYIGENTGKTPYVSTLNPAESKGTLTMATNAYFPPYEYFQNGEVVGIDVDIATAIADHLGMTLKIDNIEFDAIITAVNSGKADFGASGMTVTAERLKNIDFTNSYTTSKQVIVVRNNEVIAANANLASKFKSDFIDDNRYTYILTGLKNTLIISFFSAILGIIIGFGIAVIRSTHDKSGGLNIGNAICNIYLAIIRGTPAMVQLLIIYYIIFGSVNINKLLVAILAFGINSGAYVAEIFRSGIMSIDNGQFEAARSLGLPYSKTFRFIILPQAFKSVLPALANEFIVLLKETSISGYIGLTDLTRGGDIVRSITYDAMLPLIGVAIIYFLLVVVLSTLVKKLERRLRSNERN